MAKKYFWLKLKDDFFTDIRMKKLRRNAGGATYTLIYLKMQLLSLKKEGILLYEEVEDSFYEEIAFKIDEDPVDVEFTLMFLMKHNLLEEVRENEFALIETIKSIGSETDVAERVRKHREEKKGKHKLLQCNATETIGNTEKEIEKEKELENNLVTSEEVTEGKPSKSQQIKEQALRVYEFYKGLTNSRISPTAANMKEVTARLRDGDLTENDCYAILKYKHAECLRTNNFKYYTLISLFRKTNSANTMQQIELLNMNKPMSEGFNNNQQLNPWEEQAYGQATSWNDNVDGRIGIPERVQDKQQRLNF